ncbi:TonB-dependent receptor [Paucibacter sp. O1-1]|nr:TonB-dependent receptor [Paucibacter sp. O1-1]MDA3827405.1 TonB-dependent receptor [Paucibacter sp. O1-1]
MKKKTMGSTAARLHRSAASLAVSALVMSLSLPVLAQVPADARSAQPRPAKDGSEVNELPQVTVTATRRTTHLLKTPVAVSALKADDLVRENVKEIRNLSGMVPNVQFGLSPADSGVAMSIRGVSSTNFTEIGDPAVGVHIDGVYSPRPQGALALMFDLDGIEVLRGAQGTLFGRSSTAGVINVLSAKPDFKSDYGWTSLQLSDYNGRQLRSVYNKSLGERFALRMAYMRDTRDGFISQERDLTDRGYRVPDGKGGFKFTPDGKPDVDQRLNRVLKPSDHYYNSNQWAGRLSARWALSPQLDLQSTVERFHNKGAGEVYLRDCGMAAGSRWACGPEGQWHAKINVPGKIDMSLDTLRNNLNWKFSDSAELSLKNSYSVQKRVQHQDNDGGLHPLDSEVWVYNPGSSSLTGSRPHVTDEATYVLGSRYRTMVNEIQIKQDTKQWRYVAGYFDMREKNAIDQAQDRLTNGGTALPAGHFWSQTDRRVESKAFFAQGDLKLGEQWTATVGLRISEDTRADLAGRSSENYGGGTWYYNGKYTPPPLSAGVPHNGTDLTFEMGPWAGLGIYPNNVGLNTHSDTYKSKTYRLGLQYDLDKSQMLFASLATGYRPGGFSDPADKCGERKYKCADPAMEASRMYFREYDSETTKNLELGYKASLLNRKLDLSVVLFNTDFEGMQYTDMHTIGARQPVGSENCSGTSTTCLVRGWTTQNIGSASIRGLELEFKALPWRDGRLSGYASLLDTSIKKWHTFSDEWLCGDRANTANPCPPLYVGSDPLLASKRPYDVRGKQLPNSPKYSFALNYAHDFDIADDLVLTPSLSYRWQSKMYFRARNLDDASLGQFQKSYGNINAAVKLADGKGRWDVELWGTNLSDNVVKTFIDASPVGGHVRATFAPPRMLGVRATAYY